MVVDPERGAATWQNGWFNGPMTDVEYKLLLTLRSRGAEAGLVHYVRCRPGMRGLRQFRVVEVARVKVGED